MKIYSLGVSFPSFEPVHCSMSGSKCYSLTCIQVIQEAGQVVWYSHLFKNFPQFVVIHNSQRLWYIKKAEIDIFLELSCFFNDPEDVGNLISDSSAFSKTSLNIWKSQFTYCWNLAWRILNTGVHVHGCTCVPHPEPPSHLSPPHPIPLGCPSAPALSALSNASNFDCYDQFFKNKN